MAITDQMGYKVAFFDNNVERYPIDAVRATLKEEGSQDVIAITGLSTQFKYIQEVAKVAREEHPAALIVGGGGWLSSMPFEMMKWVPEIDIGCIGEGYNTWREILEHFEDQNWSRVKGLIYREGTKTKLSAMRPLIPEDKLDEEIPYPAYDFSPVETYLRFSAIPYSPECSGLMALNVGEQLRRLDVASSYGCAYNCDFCFHVCSSPTQLSKFYGKPVAGKPFRQHSPQYVVGLIDSLRRKYSVNFISFIDENFTTNKKWFSDFCAALEDADLATVIKWGVVGHSRTVDREMLAKGRDVGMSYISYGGESASQKVLDSIGKGQTPEQMAAAVEATHAAQINPIMSFILGFPNEDIDDVIATAHFLVDNQIHCDPFLLQPYPGSKYFDEYKDKIIKQHYTDDERDFLKSYDTFREIDMMILKRLFTDMAGVSKAVVEKRMPEIVSNINDAALKRWVLSLDDATRLSCNISQFSDVELLGLKHMVATWDLERLKKFKEQKIKEKEE